MDAQMRRQVFAIAADAARAVVTGKLPANKPTNQPMDNQQTSPATPIASTRTGRPLPKWFRPRTPKPR